LTANRFNGLSPFGKTVETVSGRPSLLITPLKRGVNENAGLAADSDRDKPRRGCLFIDDRDDLSLFCFSAARPWISPSNLSPSRRAAEKQSGIAKNLFYTQVTPNGFIQAEATAGSPGFPKTLDPVVPEEESGSVFHHSSGSPGAPAVSPAELDQTIQRVIQQDKYAWRAPREKLAKPDAKDQGVIGRFLDGVLDLIKGWGKSFFNWLGRWLDRLFRGRASPAPAPSEIDWMLWLRLVMYLLIAVVALALALFIFQAWSRRYRQPEAVVSEPIQSVPDLTDENVGADQLPEDGWIKLARKLRERGELRLALRAFYLASLAHLAWRNLITLAKFKSNHDYAVELSRRGHSFPDLQALFGENVSVFDRIWYGLHDLDSDLLARFAANVERIKTGGAG
jgi:hypothetical protein